MAGGGRSDERERESPAGGEREPLRYATV